jgi:catechol 2,3-dioxygenase-like lactoylglutathione lyase family enzyme
MRWLSLRSTIAFSRGRSLETLALQMTLLDNPVVFLATANAERSQAFYERVLGLAFVADEPPALVFRVGDRMLRIQKVEQVCAAPYTALGWAVSNVRQTVHALRAQGVVFRRYAGMNQDSDGIWLAPSGVLVAWFQDPDAHVLSLTQFP